MHQPVRIHDSDGNPITASNPLEVDVKSATLPLPTGAATSAKQDSLIAKFPDQSGGKVPVVMAAEADIATMQDDIALIKADVATLKGAISGSEAQVDVISLPATPAGTNLIGKMGIDQTTPGTTNNVVAGSQYVYDVVTFTGVGAYSANDVLGSIAALANFALANGRGGIIRELGVRVNKKSMNFALRLHFFNASDPTIAADNAQWKELWADRAKWKGYIDLPALSTAADSGNSDCSRIVHDNYGQGLSKFIGCAAGSTSIWIIPEITAVGSTAFDSAPGNTVELRIGWERL